MAKRISSYDPNAKLPKEGTRWVWEIDKRLARELIEVTEVFWNGEEWWVRTKSLMRDLGHLSHLAPDANPQALNGGMRGMTETRNPG